MLKKDTEMMPVPGTSLSSLDMARLRNYLIEIINDPEIPENDVQWEERLIGLGLLTKTQIREVVCTIAGLVLFGISPRRYLKQAGLRIMAFFDNEKSYNAVLDEVLDGPIVGRFAKDGSGNKQIIDGGLIGKMTNLLRPIVSRESDTIDEYMRKNKIWLYPWDAIRETVINAIAHRDWTRSVDIEITSYLDRLEVTSPGSLSNSMTIEKMKAGQRSPRNPTIVSILRDYGYVDARGMGVRTKIVPLMIRENHVEPKFNATEDFLKTILYQNPR